MNGRLPTFDGLIGRFDAYMGRRRGSIIEFLRARVLKRRYPPKILQSESVAKTVLNIDEALLLENFRLECLYNFRYFATMALLERSMCFFCGLGVSKRIISLELCGFAVYFPVLGQAPISGDVQ